MDPKPPKGMLQRVRCTLSISDLRALSLLVLPLASVIIRPQELATVPYLQEG